MHLVLSDMLKMRAEIVDIIRLAQDEVMRPEINYFLDEIQQKDQNYIYNNFTNGLNRMVDLQLSLEDQKSICQKML